MIVALLVVGGLGVPVTGLFIGPDGYGGRHGLDMFIYLGRFVWYSYSAVSVAALVTGLIGLRRGTLRLATGSATALLKLTTVFGTTHFVLVTYGIFHSDGRLWHAAVSAVAAVAAVAALVLTRDRLRRTSRTRG